VTLARPLLLALGFLAAGCQQDHSPIMRPGEDCLGCHDGQQAARWYAAGTVFRSATAGADQGVEGVVVTLTDSTGRQISLTSNGAGNFYTAEALQGPIFAKVGLNGRELMMPLANPGACNSCHTSPSPQGGAPGRIYAP